MKAKYNRSTVQAENELRQLFEEKSVYEMTVWVRDHAQYLKWFCNYDETKIDTTVQVLMSVSHLVYQKYNDNPDVVENFREFCIACVIELEINCR